MSLSCGRQCVQNALPCHLPHHTFSYHWQSAADQNGCVWSGSALWLVDQKKRGFWQWPCKLCFCSCVLCGNHYGMQETRNHLGLMETSSGLFLSPYPTFLCSLISPWPHPCHEVNGAWSSLVSSRVLSRPVPFSTEPQKLYPAWSWYPSVSMSTLLWSGSIVRE